MPETLKRPFDFVPYPASSAVTRRAPAGHDVVAGRSGTLSCELETLSPTLVMDSHERAGTSSAGRFMCGQDGKYIIPGTTLKGMVRSVFEVLLPSCVPIGTKSMVPRALQGCSDRSKLCPACRTFGFMAHGQGGVHQGHVNIGEARALGSPAAGSPVQLIPLFGPNPTSKHYKFGPSDDGPTGKPKGRKFYFHQSDVQTATSQNDKDYGARVVPLEPGATFTFDVQYENLSEDELAGLVAALTLSGDAQLDGTTLRLAHKLGYGKPAGLGSVDVRVTEVQALTAPEERYRSFGASAETLEASSDALQTWVAGKQDQFFGKGASRSVQQLSRILRHPPDESVTYTYYVNGASY